MSSTTFHEGENLIYSLDFNLESDRRTLFRAAQKAQAIGDQEAVEKMLSLITAISIAVPHVRRVITALEEKNNA